MNCVLLAEHAGAVSMMKEFVPGGAPKNEFQPRRDDARAI
jgi:hypothetical protein